MTQHTRKRTERESRELDRLLAWGAAEGLKYAAIAHEAGVSTTYAIKRLKSLGYLSLLCSPEEQALIRSYRNSKKEGGKAA